MISCGETGEDLRKGGFWTESLKGDKVGRWKNAFQAADKDMHLKGCSQWGNSKYLLVAEIRDSGMGSWVYYWECGLGLDFKNSKFNL